MKIKRIILAFIFICAIMFSINVSANERCILIDPGHGGSDGGARGESEILEKDINLEISKKLRDELMFRGYKVYMTREGDEALAKKKVDDLHLRCRKKKEINSDVFISIHQNKFGVKSCKGSQVWYSSNKNSKNFAYKLQNSIRDKIQNDNVRLPKDAKKDYRILRDGNKNANVILECSFLSNKEDSENIINNTYQNKFVKAIADGIDEYLKGEN